MGIACVCVCACVRVCVCLCAGVYVRRAGGGERDDGAGGGWQGRGKRHGAENNGRDWDGGVWCVMYCKLGALLGLSGMRRMPSMFTMQYVAAAYEPKPSSVAPCRSVAAQSRCTTVCGYTALIGCTCMDSSAQGGALTAINRCGCLGTFVLLNWRVVPPSCSCPSLDGLLCVNTLLAMMYVGLVGCRSFCGAPGARTKPSLVATHVHLNEK